MKRAARRARALALALGLALAACGGGAQGGEGPGPGDGASAAPRVLGTAVDGANGALLAGVRVEGPRGVRAVSDREGRFVLEGLRVGDRGEVVGTLEDGRVGRARLQPLAAGSLEIVLRLERP